jgi:hypothetical protein
LHPEAVALLEEAQSLIGQQRIPEAIKQAKDARALLVDDGSLDSDVATVAMAVTAAPAPPSGADAPAPPSSADAPVPPSGAGGGGCFIATATYGSPWHPHVNILRAFRDQYLLTNSVGARLVRLYYTYSPPMAEYIREHPIARRGARVAFVPLIGLVAFLLQTTGAEKVAVAVLILFLGASYCYRRRIRRCKVKKPQHSFSQEYTALPSPPRLRPISVHSCACVLTRFCSCSMEEISPARAGSTLLATTPAHYGLPTGRPRRP